MGKLSLRNIVKTFGEFEVVKKISLEVEHGEFVVFVGPSGCGKSTLLPHRSVFENIAFPLRVEKAPKAEIERKVTQAAKILHLDQRLAQKPGQLSGGQRQRVAIGRAIVREPKIFLFDEPLSNLDASLRADMRIELTRLHKQLGATMIYVTHDQVEAMTMADRIVVLNGGDISQIGSPLELYHRPKNTFVAGFIGNPKMNMLPVTCVAADARSITVDCAGQQLTVPMEAMAAPPAPGAALTLGIRPEHVRLGPGELTLTLTPGVIERLGQQSIGYASLPGREENFCFLVPGMLPLREDVPLDLGIAAADCHLFDAAGQAFPRQVDLAAITG